MESAVEIACFQLQQEHKINNACIGLQSNPHSAFHTSIARCTRQAKPNNVDLTVQASEQENGLDLPFDDIATLRFFFNLGVQQCRAVLLSQLHDQLRKGTTLQLHMHLPSEHLVDDVSSSSTSSSTSSDSPSSTCSLFSSNTSSACTPSSISAQSEQSLTVHIPETAPDLCVESVGLLKCADV